MKRATLFLTMFLMATFIARAQSSGSRGWYAGIASGYYFPLDKVQSSYALGGGGSYFGGYQFNDHLAFQFEWNNWLLSRDGRDIWDLKLLPEVKWAIGSRKLKPVFLTGCGYNYQLKKPDNTSSSNLVIPLGIGLQLDLHPRCRIFIQSFGYAVLGTATTPDIPVLLGFSVGL